MNVIKDLCRSLTIVIIVFFCACKEKRKGELESVSLDGTIQIEGRELSSIAPSCFWQIAIMDSLLVLNDACGRQFFNFIDMHTYTPLFPAGIEGRGPDDFLASPFIAKSVKSPLAVSEPHGNLKYVNIADQRLYVGEVKKLKAGGGSRDIVETSQRIYGKNTSQGEGLIFYQQNLGKGDQVDWIPMPASLEMNNSETKHVQTLSDNSFVVSEEKNSIVSGMRFFNRILFYDLNGNLTQSYRMDFPEEDSNKIDLSKDYIALDAPVFINGITNSEQYIYLLWYGSSLDAMQQFDKPTSSKMIVFDWSGNFVKSYLMDGTITCLAVTPDDKRLIAGKLNYDETISIMEYNVE